MNIDNANEKAVPLNDYVFHKEIDALQDTEKEEDYGERHFSIFYNLSKIRLGACPFSSDINFRKQ